jgi:hypothetical protein
MKVRARGFSAEIVTLLATAVTKASIVSKEDDSIDYRKVSLLGVDLKIKFAKSFAFKVGDTKCSSRGEEGQNSPQQPA